MAFMHQVYLSLGSNINRRENIRRCLVRLNDCFGQVISSPVYESEPVGFQGDCFFNSVVKVETDLSISQLSECLKQIEHEQGRERKGKRFSSRTLDIDILLYDQEVGLREGVELPRPEVYYNAFVLLPLSDIAPTMVDPVNRKPFTQLWAEKAPEILSKQKLWQVDFDWPEGVQPVLSSGF